MKRQKSENPGAGWCRMEREATGAQDTVEAIRGLSVFMEDVDVSELERMFYFLVGYVAGEGNTLPPPMRDESGKFLI